MVNIYLHFYIIINLSYEGRLKSNAHNMLVEHKKNNLEKRAWWHSEVTIPLYTHAHFEGIVFISSF